MMASVSLSNPRAARRKMALLQQGGLFTGDTKGATIRRAFTAEDLRKAYALVHDVFLGTGYMKPEPSGIRLRMFETLPETATFVAEVDGNVVGVLSVVGDTPDLGLPSDGAFKEELDQLRANGLRLCELTNQAVAEEYRKSAVATELMRCAVAHGMKAGYDQGIATVSPGHNGFYELMGFNMVGTERSYSLKLHDPVVALSMDLDHYRKPVGSVNETMKWLHHHGTVENHFLNRVVDWAEQARTHFTNPELLLQLFVTERNFVAECSADQLKILERRWGAETFRGILSASNAPFERHTPVGASKESMQQLQWESFGESQLSPIFS